jgi:hypothetical protein
LVLRHRGIKIRHGGCGAGHQSRKLKDIAAVGGEIRNLGIGDGLADLIGTAWIWTALASTVTLSLDSPT